MIDRIRQDIQARLDQLLGEADRLRQALTALGTDGASRTTSRSTSRASSAATSNSKSGSATKTRARAARGTSSRARSTTTRSTGGRAAGGTRTPSGGTKDSVLKALGSADGKALTASEVAAATGLGRASVSTTLSKLARAGEVEKAQRGYRLSGGAASKASGNGGAAAAAKASGAQA